MGGIITVIIIIIKIIMIITLDSNTNIQYFKRETSEVIPIRKASYLTNFTVQNLQYCAKVMQTEFGEFRYLF